MELKDIFKTKFIYKKFNIKIMKNLITICITLFCTVTFAQKEQKLNLHKLLKNNKLSFINREAKPIDSLSKNYIKLLENKGEGIVWLPIKDFKNGTIKIEMRGEDEYG